MSLKGCAALVAVLAVLIFYVHDYHGDVNIYLMKEYPAFKTLVMNIHGYLQQGNRLLAGVLVDIVPLTQTVQSDSRDKVISSKELARFNGETGSPGLYISILGKVYDVEKGKKHYGPGGTYHVFAGCDASKSFVTGDFSKNGVSDDVLDLSLQELKSLQEWAQFYHNEYEYKGKLIGRYYTERGGKTDYSKQLDDLLRQADKENQAKNIEHLKYPPCNVEWSPDAGSRVWCSTRSGGIERDWVGVPRKLFKPGSDSFRCACVQWDSQMAETSQTQKRTGNLEVYDNCAPDSDSCLAGT